MDTESLRPTLPSVPTTIGFLRALDLYASEKPYLCEFDVSDIPGAQATNMVYEYMPLKVYDIRGHENRFRIETNGFEIIRHQSSLSYKDFENRKIVASRYVNETEQLVKDFFQASKVIVIGCEVRDNAEGTANRLPKALRPVRVSHVDQTPWALMARLRLYMDEIEAKSVIENHRVMIVNVWRAISDPIEEMPLAVCDTQTVHPEDCIAVDLVKRGDYNGELFYMKYSERQRYYYLSRQRPDEVLLMAMAESDPAKPNHYFQEGVPHSSFELPTCANCPHPPRESIEIRTLVII